MRVLQIEARDFRNLAEVSVEPHRRLNVIWGENAQGKTNLLEAMYVLVCRRSFRAARIGEMIRFGTPQARLGARVSRTDLDYHLETVLRENVKLAYVDGKTVRGVKSWPHGLAAVLFTPEELRVPRGAPADRRQLLDRAVAAIWPAYPEHARDYTRTLQTRNRVLREQEGDTRQLLEVYDRQLATLGGKLMAGRTRFMHALHDKVVHAFERISQGPISQGPISQGPISQGPISQGPISQGPISQGPISQGAAEGSVRYVCKLETQPSPDDAPQLLAERMAAELAHRRAEDLARRTTTVGPHLDDLTFFIDGRPVREHASQGQVRALVLAFKIAQILDIYERFGHYPVLLLDDVSSELDPSRNKYLFDFLQGISCQLFITTTRPALIPLEEERKNFHMVNGSIRC